MGVLSKVSTLIYGDVKLIMNICFSMVMLRMYDHMLVIYNFALSTHLIVDTGCQFYLHIVYISIFAYLHEMYARACDRCVYGYAIILYVIILSSQFHNYIDHTSKIIQLWPTISHTHFMTCVNLRYIICSNGKVQRDMYTGPALTIAGPYAKRIARGPVWNNN